MTRLRATAAIALMASLLAGLGVSAFGAVQLWRAQRANATILALAAGHDAAANSSNPLVAVARARYLLAKGEIPAAQAIADDLANAPPAVQAPLEYALGNAYMRQALARMRRTPFWKIKPIFAVAKSAYRQAIQLDPDNWDARYNYAIASMFLRESEHAQPTIGEGMAHERAAWPDIPGAPNGMP
jgi:mxaK protein